MNKYPSITSQDILDEVRALVAENPDFIYTQQPESTGKDAAGTCSYVGAFNAFQCGVPEYSGQGCIMGQALSRLGVSRDDLIEADQMEDAAIDMVVEALQVDYQEHDRILLKEIQANQDKGYSWAHAVEKAEKHVSLTFNRSPVFDE